jgi:CRISPR-associated endonuclease/helicase Cas3
LNLEEKEKITIETEDREDQAEIRKLNNKYLPYAKELCEKSLTELSKYNFIDETVAIELVNTILKVEENQKIDNITSNLFNIEKIRESWNDCNKNHYRETIRDIQSIEIVLIDLENKHDTKVFPWKYETLSVYKWSFIGWAKKIEENKIDPDDWVFAKAVQGEESVFDFEWQDNDSCYLRRLPFENLKNHFDVVFVDNRYFDYTTAGLIILPNEHNIISPIKEETKKDKLIVSYKKDTFYQHNKALLNCFESEFKPNLKYVFNEFEKFWGEAVDWEKLIQLTICLHDYGKLNAAWQKPMKEFQKRKTGIDNPIEVLAHTDYDDSTDRELAQRCKIKSKPPHAGIGAFIAKTLFSKVYGRDIANIVAMAIIKHHSIGTMTMSNFSISKDGMSSISDLLNEQNVNFVPTSSGREQNLNLFLETTEEQIIYFFFVRILRLCDQRATESIEKYLKL